MWCWTLLDCTSRRALGESRLPDVVEENMEIDLLVVADNITTGILQGKNVKCRS